MTLHDQFKGTASLCDGMGYGTGELVRFPVHAPGIPARLVDAAATYIDCSSFTALLLLSAYRGRVQDPDRLYRDLQIIGRGRWSPILGIVREGLGVEVETPERGRWCLVQLWRTTGSSGHAVLVRLESDGLWVWESKQGRGPGLRVTTWAELTRDRSARLARLEE